MEDQSDLIDLNTADIAALTSLPGVGTSMAERIIAARPFASPEDLQRVSGIGPTALERIQSLVFCSSPEIEAETLSPVVPTMVLSEEAIEEMITDAPVEEASSAELIPEAAQAPEIIEAAEELAPSPPADEQTPVEIPADVSAGISEEETAQPEDLIPEEPLPAVSKPETAAPSEPISPPGKAAPPAPTVTTARVFGIAFASSILTLIFSVVFTLSFLAILNGGLRYAHPNELNSLRRSIANIESAVVGMEQDLASIETRVDNLESLSGRLAKTEQEVAQLRQNLDAVTEQTVQLSQQMELLAAQVNAMADQIEDLQKNSIRFQNFLDGLRDLLILTAETGQK
jgi:cell division protein FtsB